MPRSTCADTKLQRGNPVLDEMGCCMMKNTSVLLLDDEKVLSFRLDLAIVVGMNEAIFLRRLDQLLATELCIHENGRKWVGKTIEDWQREEFPFWSKSTIKRVIGSLIQKDVVLAIKAEGKRSFDHTKAYTIDYDRLDKFYRSPAYRFIPPKPYIMN